MDIVSEDYGGTRIDQLSLQFICERSKIMERSKIRLTRSGGSTSQCDDSTTCPYSNTIDWPSERVGNQRSKINFSLIGIGKTGCGHISNGESDRLKISRHRERLRYLVFTVDTEYSTWSWICLKVSVASSCVMLTYDRYVIMISPAPFEGRLMRTDFMENTLGRCNWRLSSKKLTILER